MGISDKIYPKPSDPKGGNGSWKVSTAPSIEPINVDDVKEFARIDGSQEDTLIEGFITAVRGATELYLGRALLSQTIALILDEWPGDVVELPKPPLISISSVVTLDEDDAETTYASSNYYAITGSIPGKLVLKNEATPPYNTERYHGGYKITYLAGYGSYSSSVPSQIKEAMKLWATAVYENRALTPTPPPQAAPLLNMYRVIKY